MHHTIPSRQQATGERCELCCAAAAAQANMARVYIFARRHRCPPTDRQYEARARAHMHDYVPVIAYKRTGGCCVCGVIVKEIILK